MAQASPSARKRPLSPHLEIWRWGPAMAVSILHRVSGNGLAFVGLAVLLWWLGALVSGPAAYAIFTSLAGSWYGQVVLIGISWAFFNHLSSGLRHFVLDLGAGFELKANAAWSWLSMAGGIVLTVAFWAAILLR
ncbi:MAG: succinate dehydrogenase, cytochrome b556 subunit [Sphingomonadales bacterium]|nr:succinate dehydrogenase, cytochrome b556 subunit [Sphingomonadales bacterium]